MRRARGLRASERCGGGTIFTAAGEQRMYNGQYGWGRKTYYRVRACPGGGQGLSLCQAAGVSGMRRAPQVWVLEARCSWLMWRLVLECGGGGVWDPRVRVPKMAQKPFPFAKFFLMFPLRHVLLDLRGPGACAVC